MALDIPVIAFGTDWADWIRGDFWLIVATKERR
jgi:hypothetical protein